ncbi:MAG: hypothetical protein IKU25_07510 [Clostridia bacterium]|nr:hypothetical protein [Clostridia bacterium]
MAKKSTVHNHVYNVTVNIDYEQLAKAVVAEQKKIKEKSKKRMDTRQLLMSWCNGILYAALYCYAIYEIITMWQKFANNEGTSLYMCIVYTIAGASLAILLFLSQQETMNDSKEETITHFNTNIALIALIVALVSLIKR